ncbi:PREDICTED: uncharacterized protein LOC109358004 [Lupinus angustifolius]|uniref:uncharacterized protein LOC109358004 n=1 Tax=Lupinus angustifolius TaxID=3871 RepID=UPI00092F75C4|nr:PREDICTED: uncharacterized protein LOC109358004 [Lupinus angustifolius]
MDGSCRLNDSLSYGAGVIRNHDGHWISRFATNFRLGTLNIVEVKSIDYGLRLAWQMGHRSIILENDYLEASHIFTKDLHVRSYPFAQLVKNIRLLLAKDWVLLFHHVFRNKLVDFMSNIRSSTLDCLHVWNFVPIEVFQILYMDFSPIP